MSADPLSPELLTQQCAFHLRKKIKMSSLWSPCFSKVRLNNTSKAEVKEMKERKQKSGPTTQDRDTPIHKTSEITLKLIQPAPTDSTPRAFMWV